ncbi:MAG: hypothetical protein ACTMIR_14835 [Cellulomonadaceae bacterium]
MGFLRRVRGGSNDTDPGTWTELWRVLRSFDGPVSVDAAARWVEQQRGADPRVLTAARAQLGRAYALLDTEAHARELRTWPFTGAGEVFGRRRFLRVVDQIVLGGPDAVAQVAADPARIRDDDTVPSFTQGECFEVPDPTETTLGVALAQAQAVAGTRDPVDLELVWPEPEWVWPSIEDLTAAELTRQRTVLDPERSWVTLNAFFLRPDQHPDRAETDTGSRGDEKPRVAGTTGWEGAARAASARLLTGLGPAPLQGERAVSDEVYLVVCRGDAPPAGLPYPLVTLGPDGLAVQDFEGRLEVLVQAAATALSQTALPWSPRARADLAFLAG